MNQRLIWILESQFGISRRQIDEYLWGSNFAPDIETRSPLPRMNSNRTSASPKRLPQTLMLPSDPERISQAKTRLDQVLEGLSVAGEESQIDGRVTPPPGSEPVSAVVCPEYAHCPQETLVMSEVSLPQYHSTPADETVPPDQQDNNDKYNPESSHHLHCIPENQSQYTHDLSGERMDACAGETSCEEAASIIVSLRGNNVQEEVWSELGCSAKQSCRVKTTSVFELLDKE
ncbi:uncharacterized protein A1O9_11871 [Exophiala aquamarina CBS 119918]|uniref:Uncharacterized protein n=1 Tax=Exophiala aquamarina CBS 119918 TaxID=1182545 RepID=A0A072NWS6_9EURO|nr:uncharacterized protein A1O9_11871 [Exophiala aquamarina CBS 119918]KEF51882.1 hypothetical protein A1O9_11871 [Exophiala aquamarina CBS 119918]